MLLCEYVTECYQRLSEIRGRIRLFHAVVQVDLYFAKPRLLYLSHSLEKTLIILLDRIKVSVAERSSVVITNGFPNGARLNVPIIEPPHLRFPIHRDAKATVFVGPLVVSRLKMVSYYQDQVVSFMTIAQSPHHLIGTPKRIPDQPGKIPSQFSQRVSGKYTHYFEFF
jgi:hypothetical protein